MLTETLKFGRCFATFLKICPVNEKRMFTFGPLYRKAELPRYAARTTSSTSRKMEQDFNVADCVAATT